MKNNDLKNYKETNKRLSAYRTMLATANYDKDTIAPKKGNKARNEAMALMSGELYSIATSKEYVDAILNLSKQDLGKEMNREIYLSKKDLEDTLKFSKEETMEYSLALMKATDAWEEARVSNNYQDFEPELIKIINLTKERLKKRNPKKDPYEILLDDFQEGISSKDYDQLFKKIKDELIPLIKEVNNRQEVIDDSFLHKYYPVDKQKEFAKILIKYLNYDSSWGYYGESEHPYTTTICVNDIRVTTHYYEYDIASSIFSLIHEIGHAYYDHQVDKKFQDTPIHSFISMGMHESQSRFNENYIGKRKAFWIKLYPELVRLFPENLKDISLDQFILAINRAHSSFIRTEADELTYPIHVLIRYEIEKKIFAGTVDLKDLSKAWNEKYKEYLGIDVTNDRDGILQDIHWANGAFGYFPTYVLGSAIGAQILNKIEKDIDVDNLLANNKYPMIQKWLRENVQHYGALYNYNEILKLATGKKFDSSYYIKYLKNKYKKLYKIK